MIAVLALTCRHESVKAALASLADLPAKLPRQHARNATKWSRYYLVLVSCSSQSRKLFENKEMNSTSQNVNETSENTPLISMQKYCGFYLISTYKQVLEVSQIRFFQAFKSTSLNPFSLSSKSSLVSVVLESLSS